MRIENSVQNSVVAARNAGAAAAGAGAAGAVTVAAAEEAAVQPTVTRPSEAMVYEPSSGASFDSLTFSPASVAAKRSSQVDGMSAAAASGGASDVSGVGADMAQAFTMTVAENKDAAYSVFATV